MRTRAYSVLGRRYHYRPAHAGNPLKLASKVADGDTIGEVKPAVDLTPLCTPVRNQGQEGACSGFATAALKEVDCAVWGGGTTPLGEYLSPAYLYARTRRLEGTWPADSGCSLADELSTLTNYGVCPETFLPYDPGQAGQWPTPDCDVAAVAYRCGDPIQVDFSVRDAVKAMLSANRAVAIGFEVPTSFETTGADGIVPDEQPGEAMLGGHAVLVVGYDATGWLVRNSWGCNWARGGYCTMKYGYEALWMEAWVSGR